MPVIVDHLGRREVTQAELAALTADSDRAFAGFWNALNFRPIAEYDRAAGKAVILRNDGDQWALGCWGALNPALWNDEAEDEPQDRAPMWRNLQDCLQGVPIAFEPRMFAEISEHDIARFSED